MPYITGNCDNWQCFNNVIEVVMIYLVQRMVVDTFQTSWFEPWEKQITKLYLGHHIIIFVGGFVGLHYESEQLYFCSYAMAEVSSMFLGFKEVYREVLGVRSKTLDALNMGLFVITFFVFRILWMPMRHVTDLMSYNMCGSAAYRLPLYLNLMSVPVTLLSFYWFFGEIIPMVRRKLAGKPKPLKGE